MTRPLSDDLRRWVITAVEDGMSRRAAAHRCGVAVSLSIKCVDAWRWTGRYHPHCQGGDNRSRRIEAHAETILAWVEATPDLTLAEIAAQLKAEHGLRVAPSSVWRFFDRRGITVKKLTSASSNALTCCATGRPGSTFSPISTRNG